MNSPLTTHLSRRRTSSKPRFPADGMAVVYMHGYFLLLSSPYSSLSSLSSLLELLVPFTKTQHDAFGPQTIPSSQPVMLTCTTIQLLAKMRLIFLAITGPRSFQLRLDLRHVDKFRLFGGARSSAVPRNGLRIKQLQIPLAARNPRCSTRCLREKYRKGVRRWNR